MVSLFASLFQKNYYLGDDQNAVEYVNAVNRPTNRLTRILDWVDNPFAYYKNKKLEAQRSSTGDIEENHELEDVHDLEKIDVNVSNKATGSKV